MDLLLWGVCCSMRGFLEQYGVGIFTLVVVAILLGFAPRLGNYIKNATNEQIANVDEIASDRVRNADRPAEPKESSDIVYACLYNNGELVLSAEEITNKENIKKDFGSVVVKSTELPKWHENASDVLTVRFETAIKPTTCRSWFSEMKNLVSIQNLEYLYTNECKTMNCMFWACHSLISINLKYFDTTKVLNMHGMFFENYELSSLNIQSFNTSHVKNMRAMFHGCKKLTVIDVSNFDTSSCAEMSGMFNSCSSLLTLDVSSFNTSSCTSMNDMFALCKSLTILDLSNWNTENVTDMWHMFTSSRNLQILDLKNFNTRKVENMDGMFNDTPLLKLIKVGANWTTALAESNNETTDMFLNCGTDHVTYI